MDPTAGPVPVRVLLVSGSTRARSTNTAALRTLLGSAGPGVEVGLWAGLVDMPAFVPEDDGREPPPVAALRRELAAADAVVFCTPEYAGSLPGSLKNALDWVVGCGELYGKPVAWINVAAPGRGGGAVAALAGVLGYVAAEVVEDACRRVEVGRDRVGADGLVHDPQVHDQLDEVLAAVVVHLRAAGGH